MDVTDNLFNIWNIFYCSIIEYAANYSNILINVNHGVRWNIVYNIKEKLGSYVWIPQKQLESNESEFEGCWGAKIPTSDELHVRVSGCTSTLLMAKAFESFTSFIFSGEVRRSDLLGVFIFTLNGSTLY
jgi:hypothetical protein